MTFTVYDAKQHTTTLIESLKMEPRREFTASELKSRTTVPKKFVRRALTVDDEKKAEVATKGVNMVRKGGLWHYSWIGSQADPS